MKATKNLVIFFLLVLAVSYVTYNPKSDPNSFENKRPRVANVIRFFRWAGLVFLFGEQPPEPTDGFEAVESFEAQPLYGAAPPAIAAHEGESLLDHGAGW